MRPAGPHNLLTARPRSRCIQLTAVHSAHSRAFSCAFSSKRQGGEWANGANGQSNGGEGHVELGVVVTTDLANCRLGGHGEPADGGGSWSKAGVAVGLMTLQALSGAVSMHALVMDHAERHA
jgi:hypothetical protein